MAKTFLQLCAAVARESGAVGSAPSTVLNQTGRQQKVVEWVRQANHDIMADNPDWSFLRREFEASLSIDTMSYTPAALGIDGSFARWLPETDDYQPMSWFDPATPECEATLRFTPYQSWRSAYFRGVHDASTPVYWSVAPDRSLVIGPKPDAAYTLRGEYQAGPQTFESDGDVSLIPEQYENAIVWRACMMLALHDEAPAAYQAAASKYAPILTNMMRDLLPAIELGGNALA